jgi:hypothetical protein
VLKSVPRQVHAQTNTDLSGSAVTNRIPVAALMHAVQTLPDESAEGIAEILADEYGWTPDTRSEAVRRIQDLQFARLSTIVAAHNTLPAVRTPASIDGYFRSVEDSYQQAQDQLYLRARRHR